jgi:hypothetical protein
LISLVKSQDHKEKSIKVRRIKSKAIHSINKVEALKKPQDKLEYLKDYNRIPIGDYSGTDNRNVRINYHFN